MPPFRFEHGYILDSTGSMVADGVESALRVRGWGRIQYMGDKAGELQDAVDALMAEALTDFWQDRALKAAPK